MGARLTLKPGQKGTRKLVELYGSRLICVRYRYDEEHQKRLKTVEIVVEETPWTPKPIEKSATVRLRIEFKETDLQRKVKAAGGKWNSTKRLWEIRYDQAVVLGLEDRIQERKASISRYQKASISR